ncbi:MAG: sugar phosphate nucleotidyltransferase [archaeon]
MKGVILAGGFGTRMMPLTSITNKHLLPVYNKPMIFYPIETLVNAGVKEIMIVTGPENAGHFLKLLGSGNNFNACFTYRIQDLAGGIADALRLARDFVGNEKFAVVLGDNVIEDDISEAVKEFEKLPLNSARIFLKEVSDPERFGVAELNGKEVVSIVEKPIAPKSNYAVTGVYFYDASAFEVIETLKPSGRGELEITDVNNHYVKLGTCKASILKGYWTDAGTFESLFRASKLARDKVFNSK